MIKIIAVLCSLASPEDCREVQITSSDFQPMKLSDCHNVPAIAQWAETEHPGDRLAGWKCVLGRKGTDI